MRILIATPLFPPDVADPAPYIKTLAARLSEDFDVTVLLYGKLPETAKSARLYPVPKELPAPLRLAIFGIRLLFLGSVHDVVLIENGIAAELPALIASFFFPRRMLIHCSDKKVAYHGWRKRLHERLAARVRMLPDLSAPVRPEILPFEPYPAEEMRRYEEDWVKHLAALRTELNHE
jgi:hypothetical protein